MDGKFRRAEEVMVGEIAARIISLAGSSSSIRCVPLPADEPRVRKPDILFAQLALGFEPLISWREGLTETMSWFLRITAEPAVRPWKAGASWLRPTGLPAVAVTAPLSARDWPAC